MGTIPSYTDKATLDGTEEVILDDSGTTKNATSYVITTDQYLEKSVAGGSTVNLTAAEAYYKRIKFTGAITANISVTIPDNTERLYVIENATTGDYTLTFKTLSGTGISVLQGQEAVLSSNGTNVTDPQENIVPSGVILLWSGAISAIPTGWAICDGTNGTPNLTDRFVIHADADSGGTNDVGDTGGSSTHKHQTLDFTGSATSDKVWDSGGNAVDVSTSVPSSGVHMATTGGAQSAISADWYSSTVSNVPKYYALAYIMKL